MPGHALTASSSITCVHAGRATPARIAPRVRIAGMPAVLQDTQHLITGCTLPPPPSANGPCVSAQWVSSATRVRCGGVPLLLQDSQAVCSPTGTGLIVVATQLRVRAV